MSDAQSIDIRALAAPFPMDGIEWRVGTVSKNKPSCTLLCYLTSRAVMDRLDTVVGPLNWRDEYADAPGGGIRCGISVYNPVTGEWVTKWDAADPTQIEATKGGHSDAFKRAAVKWGIGRYLYRLDTTWVKLVEGFGPWGSISTNWNKKMHHVAQMPRLPAWALPEGQAPKPEQRPRRPAPKAQGFDRKAALAVIDAAWSEHYTGTVTQWAKAVSFDLMSATRDELVRLLGDVRDGTVDGAANALRAS